VHQGDWAGPKVFCALPSRELRLPVAFLSLS
jgi:hypothetical protein